MTHDLSICRHFIPELEHMLKEAGMCARVLYGALDDSRYNLNVIRRRCLWKKHEFYGHSQTSNAAEAEHPEDYQLIILLPQCQQNL